MQKAEAINLQSDSDQNDQSDHLKQQLSERIEQSTTLNDGFRELASAFSTFNINVDRITMIRDSQTFDFPVNQHASGIRRQLEAQANDLTLTVVCTTTMTPDTNACLQALVTLAAITAQQWTGDLTPDTSLLTSKMLGNSPQMQKLQLSISRAARSIHNTLLRGESGTGKTTAAFMIHEQSSRADKPFIDLNCATLPEALLESELFGHEKGAFTGATSVKKGLFEIADGGTLFLDEIGELRSELQAKLLTAIEQKKIRRLGSTKDIQCDLRVISASSRNLQHMVSEGTFREDLYYRIAVLEINIAPLRERPSDIPTLVFSRLVHEQALIQRETPFQIDDDALKTLMFYDWPGNIRQLQNTISRLAVLVEGDAPITANDVTSQLPLENMDDAVMLPMSARILLPGETMRKYMNRVQMLIIDATVAATGNQTQAATRLDYTRSSLVILKQRLQRSLKTKKTVTRTPRAA